MSKYNTYLYRLRTIIAGSYRKYMLYVLAIESAIRRHVTLRRLLYAGIGTLLALIAIYSVTFLWPRTVQFSYSDKNCFVSPTLLPRLADTKTSQSFTIEQQEGLSVGGYAVYSHRSCIKALQAPRSNATEEVSLTLPGSPLAQKRIMIKS
ncbi:MAG TPA: hypothetical protein VFM05_06640, partial [Candidatus Saccharimonadales bacterium]|nr:hypothetical protein [Candidatus Saccharimonadales bacterium]